VHARSLLLLAAIATSALAVDMRDGKAWLHPAPSTCTFENWKELPDSDYFEVPASKEYVAELRDLTHKRFVLLTQETAQYYIGEHYLRPSGKRPFLVRAVFANGGTGSFKLYRCGDALLVSHSSLGHAAVYYRSALVVNLAFTPKDVYTDVQVAE